jgi:hypothetical protein
MYPYRDTAFLLGVPNLPMYEMVRDQINPDLFLPAY